MRTGTIYFILSIQFKVIVYYIVITTFAKIVDVGNNIATILIDFYFV
jgi:hypothetical protein